MRTLRRAGGVVSSSDPVPGGTSEPSRSWLGNILQQTPSEKPKRQRAHGRDPASGPCLLARPAPAAGFPAQPALCQLPEAISTVPCMTGSGFPVGPQPQVEIAAPQSRDPQSRDPQSGDRQSSECAAWPAATGGPSSLPEGPFQQPLTPLSSVLPVLGASLSSPIVVQLQSPPLPVGGGGGGGGRRHFIQIPSKKQSHWSLCTDVGLSPKGGGRMQAPQDLARTSQLHKPAGMPALVLCSWCPGTVQALRGRGPEAGKGDRAPHPSHLTSDPLRSGQRVSLTLQKCHCPSDEPQGSPCPGDKSGGGGGV